MNAKNIEQASKPTGAFKKYIFARKANLFRAVLFSVLNKLFDLAPPFLISAAVDVAVRRENSFIGILGIKDLTTQFLVLGAATLFIWVMESLFEYLYKIDWRRMAQDVQHRLRLDAYSHIQHLEMGFFEERQTGGIMAILNDDINQLERFLDTGINGLVQLAITVVVISGSFFLFSPEIAWMAMLPVPFIILFSIKYQRYLKPKYAAVREKVGIMNGILSNNLTGMSTIQSYNSENYEKGRVEAISNEYKEANNRAIAYSAAFTPLIRMIIVVGFTLMLVFGGLRTIQGLLEVAAYSAMVFLTQRLLWPLTGLGETLDQLQRALASAGRVEGLLSRESVIADGSRELSIEAVKGEIILKDVGFCYPGREPLFKGLTAAIQPGHSVAFVGATGVGKSTIVKLLLRFYDYGDGSITLDGTDIRDLKMGDMRQAMGLVKQDTFVIDGTVRENIAYGKPDTPLEEVIRAAKVAELHGFIESLPRKYETLVGERGQKLSGGQRQRIAIARAVLKNPPILILDEATSSVDNETEAAIQKSLEKMIKGRTTIIIAHRLSTVRNVDRIFVLDTTGIAEEGTHDQLIAMDGIYAGLWKVQTGAAHWLEAN